MGHLDDGVMSAVNTAIAVSFGLGETTDVRYEASAESTLESGGTGIVTA